MNRSRARAQPLPDLIGDGLPAEELERLADVDQLLRLVAARDPDVCAPPRLRLITTAEAATPLRPRRADQQTYELRLTFSELALVYKSLQAVKTLDALPAQDELLGDTIRLVDLAMTGAV